jgi:hypothetical protein
MWPAHGDEYAWERVDQRCQRADQVPDLIRELVRTGPPGGDRYVGTSIVEDLVMDREDDSRESEALDLLLKARLTQAELFGVLSGVYVHYLEALDIRTRLAEVLSSEQLDGLLDNSAPHRWSDGTMEVEATGLRFVPGPSEWHVLYWLPNHREDGMMRVTT